jgi:hypothetical protein
MCSEIKIAIEAPRRPPLVKMVLIYPHAYKPYYLVYSQPMNVSAWNMSVLLVFVTVVTT